MKKLVDAACVRLNEFNDQLRQISLSEYHYIDGSLVELKLVPYDVEILHPCLFHHRDIDVEDFIRRIQVCFLFLRQTTIHGEHHRKGNEYTSHLNPQW